MPDHPIGSFEWAKQIVTDANAGVLAMSKPIGGSPQLDQPLRSRERAALDEAVRCLRIMARPASEETPLEARMREAAEVALTRIAALVPETIPRDIHGEPMRNTDRRP